MSDKCLSADIFKNLKLRVTRQRETLMSAILAMNQPFTAQSVFENILQKEEFDLVTVYRFLNLLYDKGLVRIITESDGKTVYEMACQHNPIHPHFICDKCHQIQCLRQLSVDDYLRISSYAGTLQIKELKIVFGGLCETCRQN